MVQEQINETMRNITKLLESLETMMHELYEARKQCDLKLAALLQEKQELIVNG